MDVLYTAAHSGFDLSRVPLGGGAAVCEHLTSVWRETRPFTLQVIGPECLADTRPVEKDLVTLSEMDYARFCRAFERKTTEIILQHSPKETAILCNDVSEGPDFRRLAAAGYRLYTIYHVDVVDYISRVYLHGVLKPERLSWTYAGLEKAGLDRFVPDVLKLVVQKQADSVRYSKGLIVPSSSMKDVLLRCYPETDPAKIHVLPWGIWEDPVDAAETAREREKLTREFSLTETTPVLLTLSRISPEKAQDRLLKALALWEASADYPQEDVVFLLAGEAAYMQGRRFESKLRRLAGRLRRTHVHFVGYASGARKRALFESAGLYVFPSRHESYGLTLLEAMRAGLPVLACDDHGTREVMRKDVGEILPPSSEREIPCLMKEALVRLMGDRSQLKSMGRTAKAWATSQPFSATAERLAALLRNAGAGLAFILLLYSSARAQSRSRDEIYTALRSNHVLDSDRMLVHFSQTCTLKIEGDFYPVVDLQEIIQGSPSPRGVNSIVILNSALKPVHIISYTTERPLFCLENQLYLFGDLAIDHALPEGNVLSFSGGGRSVQLHHVEASAYPIPPTRSRKSPPQ